MTLSDLAISLILAGAALGAGVHSAMAERPAGRWTIPDTGQSRCYDDRGPIRCPASGERFAGQDAQVARTRPSFVAQGDGTVRDRVTGLTWTAELGPKVGWEEAVAGAARCRVGGHDDWRLPTIKELYSLIDFDGGFHRSPADSRPYLDTEVFAFEYGDPARGERTIDAQYWSSTRYVGTTMGGAETVFGVNFADGRIKGYPTRRPGPRGGGDNTLFVRYVRGAPGYGVNDLADRGDGTVADRGSGLVWQRVDDGVARDWEDALAYCAGLELGGADDWRLPDAKELQSLVDYTRAPAVTGTAAIDPALAVTDVDAYFWTSTTHLDGPRDRRGSRAVYVAFGAAMGYLEMPPRSGRRRFLDVHGAGAQRSDPKSGDPGAYPVGLGPQGDDIRIRNRVRCVR